MTKLTQEQLAEWVQTAENLTAALTLAYEAGRKDENEACIKTLEDFSQTRMVPVKDTWRMGLIAGAHALRRRGENND